MRLGSRAAGETSIPDGQGALSEAVGWAFRSRGDVADRAWFRCSENTVPVWYLRTLLRSAPHELRKVINVNRDHSRDRSKRPRYRLRARGARQVQELDLALRNADRRAEAKEDSAKYRRMEPINKEYRIGLSACPIARSGKRDRKMIRAECDAGVLMFTVPESDAFRLPRSKIARPIVFGRSRR